MLSSINFPNFSDTQIAELARNAAILEVSVSPKPGLVCPETAGAHLDMDYHTFINSALTLTHYFERSVYIGRQHYVMPAPECFTLLRHEGVQAEKNMYAATNGVNTHKGLIFSLGLICCAVGRLLGKGAYSTTVYDQKPLLLVKAICEEASLLIQGIVERELQDTLTQTKNRPLTAGERIYKQYGIAGIRGEAQEGFPNVIASFDFFTKNLTQEGFNFSCCKTLLFLISQTDDTNILNRKGMDGLQQIKQNAKELLNLFNEEFNTHYRMFCTQSTLQNLSPGGCADMLALTLFFYLMLGAPQQSDSM